MIYLVACRRARPRTLGCLTVIAAAMIQACSSGHEESQIAGPRKVRVMLQPYLAMAPLLIADAESLFAKHGIEVEFVRMNSAADALPLLLSGAIDVLPGTIVPGALNAMARGDNIRIVADKGFFDANGCTHIAIIARRGLMEGNGASSIVRRLSTDRGASSQYFVRKALEGVGLDFDSLDVVEIPHVPEIEALSAGSIDAALTGEPWLSRALRARKGDVWISAQRVLPDFQYSSIFYGPNLLERDRDSGRRFMAAYREGVAQYLEGKTPRNVDIIARATGEDASLVRESCWLAMRADSRINLSTLLEFQRWASAHGFVARPATAAQIWDSSFVVWSDTILNRHTRKTSLTR